MELNKKIDELKTELIEKTQEIMRIKSVETEERPGMPFGEGINNALISVLKIGENMGFKTKNIDGYMGYIEYGEGDEIVGILGHLDVVPAGDGWKFDPYGAEIHDNKLYGRGALDDKGPIMACIYGLYALKETGYKSQNRIRILLGTNEESGSRDIEYYLKKEEKPSIGFTPDAYFPVIFAEKGITTFSLAKEFKNIENSPVVYIKGGNKSNMVPDYCEVGLKLEDKEALMRKVDSNAKAHNIDLSYEIKEDLLILKCKGNSAHGSTPEQGKNAVMQTLIFLNWIEIDKGEIGKIIKFLAENIGLETNGKTFGVYLKDEVSGELSFNVGTINMNRDMVSIGMNLRYPVTCILEQMMNPLQDKIKETGFNIEGLMHQPPLYFPKDHELIKTLCQVYEEQTGEKAKPIAMGGGTYAKEMPNIVAFGPIFPGKPDLDHQANEYIEIDDLVKLTKIYGNAIKQLSV
ncbi:dipeptidase PepV [Clostridium sp. DJ247]|uniref:dipeptidase PepV n=1 Tax=Clostridium sp. DJ247 TaxID=2726188 RepID=UPI001623C225|nr:dipeptidase PepV [Clostridium sp. DJ247]MBC2581179.1 dipeptidase PepV [Clostridium sp. DJ247]